MNYTPNEPPRAMSAAEIEEILPHRYPFALVDKILDYTPGQWARGVKCVTRTEPFFEGHFPGHPVMPGVLILEALAQTGAVAALSLPENRGKLALFGGVKNARFRRQVRPGDVLILEGELIEQHGPDVYKRQAYCCWKNSRPPKRAVPKFMPRSWAMALTVTPTTLPPRHRAAQAVRPVCGLSLIHISRRLPQALPAAYRLPWVCRKTGLPLM